MYKFSRLKIGIKVSLWAPFKPGPAIVVDLLVKNYIPSEEAILTYYGADAPRGVFKATSNDRWVLRRNDGSYVIIPEVYQNYKLFELEE